MTRMAQLRTRLLSEVEARGVRDPARCRLMRRRSWSKARLMRRKTEWSQFCLSDQRRPVSSSTTTTIRRTPRTLTPP